MLDRNQMTAVTSGGKNFDWEDIPLPTGVQPLPDWLKGLHVDFMMDCGNSPYIRLKVAGDVYTWPGQVWTKEDPAHYRTRSPDGRVKSLHHSGEVYRGVLWRTYVAGKPLENRWAVADNHEAAVQAADAKRDDFLNPDRVLGSYWTEHFGVKPTLSNTCSAFKVADITRDDHGGFGGSHYLLPMADGTERLLRGPWSGGSPPGCVDVSTWDMTRPDARSHYYQGKPWHRRGGAHAGIYITEDLFLRAVARFAPHLRVARVGDWGLEPYLQEWGMPKGHWQRQKP